MCAVINVTVIFKKRVSIKANQPKLYFQFRCPIHSSPALFAPPMCSSSGMKQSGIFSRMCRSESFSSQPKMP